MAKIDFMKKKVNNHLRPQGTSSSFRLIDLYCLALPVNLAKSVARGERKSRDRNKPLFSSGNRLGNFTPFWLFGEIFCSSCEILIVKSGEIAQR